MADLGKTIEGLTEFRKTLNDVGDFWEERLVKDALELLQQFRWISVGERLPEYTGTYLVWVGVNQVGEGMHMECRTAMFYYPSKMFYVHKEVQDEMLGGVVKWMPTPPEGGKQDG